ACPPGCPQASHAGDIDDAPAPVRDHAGTAHGPAQQEIAADVEVHDLVPAFGEIVLDRCAAGCAGVVDQGVYAPQALEGLARQALDVVLVGTVGGDPLRLDAVGLELRPPPDRWPCGN